ncbi:MAG: hypothetical protein IID36_03385 [Planctomycetes bacterium]|nr:hypothetical protein [Planctomycetota bacterium]
MVFVIDALARPVVSSCRDHQFQPVPLTGWNEVMFHLRYVPCCDRWRVAHVRATATVKRWRSRAMHTSIGDPAHLIQRVSSPSSVVGWC